MVGLTLECPSQQSTPPNYGHTLILLYPQISKLVPPNLVTFSPSLESEEERELERERESSKDNLGVRNIMLHQHTDLVASSQICRLYKNPSDVLHCKFMPISFQLTEQCPK